MKPLGSTDPTHIGPHRVLAILGAGGMGKVYLARTPQRRLAAVKVIHRDLTEDPAFLARFAREVRTAQMVRGPFTPAIFAADLESATPWMATEYVPGPTLGEAVKAGGPFPEDSLRVLTLGLARALRSIHAAGLMHRDLKPGNVLISPRGPQVIDFGIARAVEGTVLTKTGEAFGTPSYTSPEAVLGQPQSPASDVFSLAGVVVFAATGEPPFGKGRAAEVLTRVVGGEPRLERVPEDLRPLLARCMAKDPAERPTSDSIVAELSTRPLPSAEHGWLPSQVHQEIDHHERESHRATSASETTQVRSPSRGRRRTALVVGAAAATIVLVGGTGLALTRPWATEERPSTATAPEEPAEEPEESEPEWDGVTGFGSFINDLMFTPDGAGLYVLTPDAMTFWDWESGEFRHAFEPRPSTYDLADDGTMASSYPGTTLIHDPEQEVLGRFDTRENDLTEAQDFGSVSISPDGSLVAMVTLHPDDEYHLHVWNRSEDVIVGSIELANRSVGTRFSPDGSRLTVTHDENGQEVMLFDVETLGEELEPLPEPTELIGQWDESVFSPDEPVIAVPLPDENIALYDFVEDEVVREIQVERGRYQYLAFSPDGRRLYTAGAGDTVSGPVGGGVWDVDTGEELTAGQDTFLVNGLAVHPENRVVASISRDDALLILDAETLDIVNEIR